MRKLNRHCTLAQKLGQQWPSDRIRYDLCIRFGKPFPAFPPPDTFSGKEDGRRWKIVCGVVLEVAAVTTFVRTRGATQT